MPPQPANAGLARAALRGLGLIELAIGSTVTLVLLLAVGSTIHLMTRGAAGLQASSQRTTDAALAMARLQRELAGAVTISALSASRIAFTHPDLDDDGSDDAIEYEWSGTPGDPLVRKATGRNPVNLVDAVQQFRLAWETRQDVFPGQPGDFAGEQVLAARPACPTGASCDFSASAGLTLSTWQGQQFIPQAAGAQSVTITRLVVYLKRTAELGRLQAAIRDAAGNVVYQETSIPLQSVPFGGYYWQPFIFPDTPTLTPGTPCSFSIGASTASPAACLGLDEDAAADGSYAMTTASAGSTWSFDATHQARFIVYGRPRPAAPQTFTSTTRTFALRIDVRLTLAGGGQPVDLRAAVACPNLPEITGLH